MHTRWSEIRRTTHVLIPICVALVLICISGLKLLHTRVNPSEDQLFLVRYSFDAGYPTLEDGISTFLITGFYRTIGSSNISVVDAHIRTLAMSVFLVAGTLLVWQMTKNISLIAFFLGIGLLYTSRIVLLWLSSEVFAAAFLMLTLWSVRCRLPFVVTSIFIALFALAKPDLLSSGIIVALFLAWSEGSLQTRIWRTGIVLGALGLFFIPGFLEYGRAYGNLRGRGFLSFTQHYAALVKELQLTANRPNPWGQESAYIVAVWGPVTSLGELIRTNPYRYMDFVFLSLAKSIRNLVPSNVMWLLPLAAYGLYRTDERRLKYTSLLYLTGLIPIILLAFLHIRYQARFYALAVGMIGLGVPYMVQHRQRLWIVSYVLLLLLWQSYQFIHLFPAGYWLPD